MKVGVETAAPTGEHVALEEYISATPGWEQSGALNSESQANQRRAFYACLLYSSSIPVDRRSLAMRRGYTLIRIIGRSSAEMNCYLTAPPS